MLASRNLLLLIATMVFLLLPRVASSQTAQALFEKGYDLFKKGDLATAETFLKMGLEQDGNNVLGHYYLAEVLAALHRPLSEPLDHYRAVIRLSPESQNGLDSLAKKIHLEARQKEIGRMRQPIFMNFWKASTRGSFVELGESQRACAWLLPKSKVNFEQDTFDVSSVKIFVGVISGLSPDDHSGMFTPTSLRNRQYSEYMSTTAQWRDDVPSQSKLEFKNFEYVSGRKFYSFNSADFVYFSEKQEIVFRIQFDDHQPIHFLSDGKGCN